VIDHIISPAKDLVALKRAFTHSGKAAGIGRNESKEKGQKKVGRAGPLDTDTSQEHFRIKLTPLQKKQAARNENAAKRKSQAAPKSHRLRGEVELKIARIERTGEGEPENIRQQGYVANRYSRDRRLDMGNEQAKTERGSGR